MLVVCLKFELLALLRYVTLNACVSRPASVWMSGLGEVASSKQQAESSRQKAASRKQTLKAREEGGATLPPPSPPQETLVEPIVARRQANHAWYSALTATEAWSGYRENKCDPLPTRPLKHPAVDSVLEAGKRCYIYLDTDSVGQRAVYLYKSHVGLTACREKCRICFFRHLLAQPYLPHTFVGSCGATKSATDHEPGLHRG